MRIRACTAFEGCSRSTRSLLVEVNLSLTALGVVNITCALCVLVVLGNARACFTPEVCLSNDPDFLPLESVDYCTLALPPHAGIRGVTWQILHPIANTLPLLAAFKVSFRPRSCWPRGLTTRVGLDEAPPLLRTLGDNRPDSTDGSNICHAEGLPLFAMPFRYSS